jgi:hypothetical protein
LQIYRVLNHILGRGGFNDTPFVNFNLQKATINFGMGIHERNRCPFLKQWQLIISRNNFQASIRVSNNGLSLADNCAIKLLLFRHEFNRVHLVQL